jgi:hypothetical protein
MVHGKEKRIYVYTVRKQLDESIKEYRIAHLLLRKHTASKDTGKIALLSNIMIAFNYPSNALESLRSISGLADLKGFASIRKLGRCWHDQAEFVSSGQTYSRCSNIARRYKSI